MWVIDYNKNGIYRLIASQNPRWSNWIRETGARSWGILDEGRTFVRVVSARIHLLFYIPRDFSCIILPVALLGAIIISLGTRSQKYGPNNVGIIRFINNSYNITAHSKVLPSKNTLYSKDFQILLNFRNKIYLFYHIYILYPL